MHTSLGLLVGTTLLLAQGGPPAQEIDWRTNYSAAQAEGRKAGKPLAVFVGAGRSGYEQLVREGSLTDGARKLLRTDYVPVYLDARKPENRQLIEDLGIPNDRGLVLSDRSGDVMAFQHDGTLSAADISRQLRRFADPDIEVRTTSRNTTQRDSFYPPSYGASSATGQPSYNSGYTLPVGGFGGFGGGFGGFGGGFGGGGGGGC